MASGKATPRQKMINMMYLVLTALLALNVSKEILNAFVIMDDGLSASATSVEKKNNSLLADFKAAAATQPKFVDAYNKAVQANKLANALVKDVQDLKLLLIKECEGDATEAIVDGKIVLAKLGKKDDYDTPTRVMVGLETGPPGKGADLKLKLRKYVKDLLALANPKDSAALHKAITIYTKDEVDPDEPEINTWEAKIFHHTPMAAAIAHLSKIQGDVRNAEGETIGNLFASVTKRQVSFDKFTALAYVKDGFIFTGSSTEATIGLGAFDSSQKLKIRMTQGPPVNDGMIKDGAYVIPINGGSVGEQTLKGDIIVFDPEKNADVAYPFETHYVVGAPMATISPIKMNVMYIGVENPIDVSVSGVAASNVQASFPGCTVSGSGGHYIVKPTTAPGTKCLVNVSAKMPDGSSKAMGKMEFRIKRVPDPVGMYIGSKGGNMATATVKAGQGINCVLENFDFDLKFNITSFTMGANIKGNYMEANCSGPAFNSQAKDILSRLGTGAKVFFDNIKAKGPDGTSRTLAPFFVTCR
jgi:gliding motility-associated protein GldM